MISASSFAGINYWAVLVCAIATMVIGFIWYSPFLFAGPWMRLMGIDPADKAKLAEMQKGAGKLYGLSFVASLVSAVVLAKIIDITTVNTILYGMKVGLAVWLGFVTTVQLTGTLFSNSLPNSTSSTPGINWCASWRWERSWQSGRTKVVLSSFRGLFPRRVIVNDFPSVGKFPQNES